MAKTRFINFCLIIVSVFLSLEIAGYYSQRYYGWLLYDKYPHIEKELHKRGKQELFSFFMKTQFSPITGWTQPVSSIRKEESKVFYTQYEGKLRTYSHDAYGARSYTGYDARDAQVLLLGDSYTWGYEIEDNDTIAAHMFQRSGIITANLGYRAYCPLQAFLRGKEARSYFPNAKVVILGIMYDDIFRLVNSYRPVMATAEPVTIGLKPYMKDGAIIPLPSGAYDSWQHYMRAAYEAAETDYWTKPVARFPYSLSLLRATYTYIKTSYIKGHPFQTRALDENLFALATMYANWASQEHLVPIIYFLPANYGDLSSATPWIQRYQHRLPNNLKIEQLNFDIIDKSRYNLTGGQIGHPSPYGADQIGIQYLNAANPYLKSP